MNVWLVRQQGRENVVLPDLILPSRSLALTKADANERKESLLSISRVQLGLYKADARRAQQQGGKTWFYLT